MNRAIPVCLVAVLGAAALSASAQDSRTVTEPVIPASCAVLNSTLAIVNGAPVSETLDTARIQAALNACTSGKAVELAASADGTMNGYIMGPINIPNGVGLIVDGGVTVFASRNPADFQISGNVDVCGSYGAGNGCKDLITFNNGSSNSGSGIYGYGIIDGRGGSTMLVNGVDSGVSWWTNADNANTAGKSQDNFIIMKPSHASNLTLYKITLRNSPMFHVGTSSVNGFTVWGVKIQAPFTAHNTDGIDPQGTNVTIQNASISDGDDDIAVGASSASSNVTINQVTTYSGHGISVGSYTQGGLSNMLVENSNMAGTAADGNATGLRLKSAADRGGTVKNITYQNICIRDVRYPIQLNPLYNTNPGSSIPLFQNITYQNVHVLPPTSTKYPYKVQLQGYDANHITTTTWNNLVIESLVQSNVTPAPQDITITLQNNVYPAFLQTLTGTNVTYNGGTVAADPTLAYNCSNLSAIFPYIVGELYGSTATATNLQSANIATGGSVTLNAMVEPAMSPASFSGTVGSYTGAAAPTQPVTFYEGTHIVGTGTLGANGTLASVTVSGISAGTHTYTAQYPGDTNYPAITFGSVTVTASGLGATTTTLSAPSTGTFGASTALSATVSSGTSGTPTGTVSFFEGTKLLTTATLSSGTASATVSLGGGAHTLTAVYGGDLSYSTSTSAPAVTTIATAASSTSASASPTTVSVNGTTTVSVTVAGVSGAAAPSGQVVITDAGTTVGTITLGSAGTGSAPVTLATPGNRTLLATYAGDANYAGSSANTTVQVTAASTTTLSVPLSGTYGANVAIGVAVTGAGPTPTGSVTLYDGTNAIGSPQTLINGVTLFNIASLAGGTHSLTAKYNGDATYLASTSAASNLTVGVAGSSTAVTTSASSVAQNGSVTLTATVTGLANYAAPSGSVTFTDGGTTLGTATLSNGVATLSPKLTASGPQTVTATYSGDTNYAASSGTVAETVTIPTTTTLALSTATAYPGASVTMTATVSPAAAGLTVTFLNGSTSLTTAITNSAGVATYTLTAPSAGTYTLGARAAGDGNYIGSTAATQTLTVVTSAVSVSASPSTVNITAGNSGSVTINLTANGGFSGPVTLACASPVSYITCTVSPQSLNLSTTATATVNIAVASTVSALNVPAIEGRGNGGTFYAWMLPFGLLGLAAGARRRRTFAGKTMLTVLLVAGGLFASTLMTGCGGSSSTPTAARPTGTQTLTITATAAGASQTTNVTVNMGS